MSSKHWLVQRKQGGLNEGHSDRGLALQMSRTGEVRKPNASPGYGPALSPSGSSISHVAI